ncbi:MAG: AbrB/MazE/SpoVT family DNA-binding domain-containing protein [Armatimonadetes bacterium CG_4_10_14_3_um_filter_66_18]|nr:AbrB/MazE/SpoVT family DNA-binding domain-containing protein [Armatimonadota bacterium]OIO92691.1 MAG: peptidase [Armatimonadetes bacterium CG2_30_66_41]PIU88886.1 MAG: AbrB/MazE/SpoVT family DNA-binding domain-containing protein [Armatimonadetes bacterium CG06_land_8_20_14_3_00_66_21]PIY42253.1 MAG: AbrB/MazE/SpoVT family DNA-binding domain-containing protein [Armatimonadetes bacterium CG_4_10_14_3_um_filter_66_18]NCQ27859.1 AbrB/MazE/SpoVT family DNA-binding domain-containing protein [Arma
MHVSLVQIGNSRGIRIPKRILDQCEITDAVDLAVKGRKIVLEPLTRKPRDGWAAAATRMHELGDDELMMPDVFGDEADEDWA